MGKIFGTIGWFSFGLLLIYGALLYYDKVHQKEQSIFKADTSIPIMLVYMILFFAGVYLYNKYTNKTRP
ncbi:hypothetical protein SAMN05428975_2053 [Mucilaginibacter sp. OK268]|uniref:hypothetical protein n=1 Tax=Mucilaginibacter sp. OK268 TaxID=1881048 RepID=UPI00088F34D1|nr:hypothetical protein [Mucilaginibacter sp. OK268]SDP60831.1 hypothetical protein SAMN05428975_2053 [Mucilaginibacter sp. OK268]